MPSLRPSTFSQGGLVDDVDVEFTRARFVLYDFEGKSDRQSLCLCVQMRDAEGGEHVQYYSAGDPQYFMPSEDPKNEDMNGVTFVKVGEKENLNGSTNCALFLNSLVQAGFPEDKLDSGDARVLEGVKAHVNRVPQPKRSNLPKKPGQEDKTPMVLVVTKLLDSIATPGNKAPARPGASGGVSASKPPATPTNGAANGELVEELTGELIGLFASKGVAEMKKVEISKGLFGSIEKSNPNKNKMISLAAKDDVLKSLEGFSYNGSVLAQK